LTGAPPVAGRNNLEDPLSRVARSRNPRPATLGAALKRIVQAK
jgi:hypothetical protein